jgi:hypothetical protein
VKILAQLPVSLQCLFVLAYHIGNPKGALLELKWPQVDFKNGVIQFIRLQDRKAGSLGGSDLRRHGRLVAPAKGIPRRAFSELRVRLFLVPHRL